MKIKQERIMLLRELLVTQMNHWTFFPLYIVFVVILSNITNAGAPNPLHWLFLGVLPFLFYVARSRLKFVPMLLLHMAVMGISIILPSENMVIRIFQVAVTFLYVIYSIVLRVNEREKKDGKVVPLLMMGISVLTLYLLHYLDHREWDFAIITGLIVIIALYFLNYYVEQYQNFLTVNQSSAGHIPAREMFHSGMSLVAGYTGIGVAILILVSNANWLLVILNAGKGILGFLLRGIQALFSSDEPPKEELTISESTGTAGGMMEGLEPGDGFWLWQVLEYIIIFILFVLLAIVLVKCFISLSRLLLEKLKQSHAIRQEVSADEVVEVREKCEIIRDNHRKRDFLFWNLKPAERIRQLYKKRILASQSCLAGDNQSRSLNLFTARECGRILEREELAYLYEKARYSQEECNNEDVKRMKTVCK